MVEAAEGEAGAVPAVEVVAAAVLCRCPRPYPIKSVPSSRLPDQQSPTWIGLILRDFNGEPITNENFSVTLDDGQVHSGSTDSQGRARIEGVQPGRGNVTFQAIPDEETVHARQEAESEHRDPDRQSRGPLDSSSAPPTPDQPLASAPPQELQDDDVGDDEGDEQ